MSTVQIQVNKWRLAHAASKRFVPFSYFSPVVVISRANSIILPRTYCSKGRANASFLVRAVHGLGSFMYDNKITKQQILVSFETYNDQSSAAERP